MKLTQEQMAEYLGVTAPAVHKWEKMERCRGRKRTPDNRP